MGRFVRRLFCVWDVLSIDSFVRMTFCLGVSFDRGMFVPYDVLAKDVMSVHP